MTATIWRARVPFFLQTALACTAATALVLVGLVVSGESIEPVNAVLVLLLLTLLVSARFGFLPGLATALVADFVLFYFFFEPTLVLWATDPEHVVALLVFLLVAGTFGFILEAGKATGEWGKR